MSRTYYKRECERCSATRGEPLVFDGGAAGQREQLLHAIDCHPHRVVDYILLQGEVEHRFDDSLNKTDDDLLDVVFDDGPRPKTNGEGK